jgi:hypothetical protein
MSAELTPQQRYYEIMAAVEAAVESEQLDGPAPFSLETEKRVDFVSRLVKQALGLPQED